MTSTEIQREILLELRSDARGLDEFQIAASTGQATFRVRAELKALKREWLVRETLHERGALWFLTPCAADSVSTSATG